VSTALSAQEVILDGARRSRRSFLIEESGHSGLVEEEARLEIETTAVVPRPP
jgi:hypothetical protein